MKTFKTIDKHKVPYLRKFIDEYVYLRVTAIKMNDVGIRTEGYYYIIKDDKEYVLDEIYPSTMPWNILDSFESRLSDFISKSLKNALFQRLVELTFMKLQLEGLDNYEIPPNNWRIHE